MSIVRCTRCRKLFDNREVIEPAPATRVQEAEAPRYGEIQRTGPVERPSWQSDWGETKRLDREQFGLRDLAAAAAFTGSGKGQDLFAGHVQEVAKPDPALNRLFAD